MLKILSNQQIREADRATIQNESIESVDLMERAAKGCVDWFTNHYDTSRPVLVLAGVGNNGGDALVMARRLLEKQYAVSTFVVRYSESFSEDLQINLDRLESGGHEVQYILEEAHIPSISSDTVVIDGLFGSGLNRPVKGLVATCIDQINASIAEVVSIDLPSGLYADQHTSTHASVISASHTLTFQVPKLAFFVEENQEYIGKWRVIEIGLDQGFLGTLKTNLHFVDQIQEYSSVFGRQPYDHKGKFGHGLLIAGRFGSMGAAVLAGRAAMRSGIGRLTMHIPHTGYNIMQTSLPEAMCSIDDYDEVVGELPDISSYEAIGMGPGIGTSKKTRRMLRTLIQSAKVPLLFDADALNLLADNKDVMKSLPKHTILTPHIKEFERMFGVCKHSFERLEVLKHQASKLGVIIVLKGKNSAIATPDGSIYINSTGNPGMATAGSGDVLTGIILSLLAQCKDPLIATICGVYVHGAAGDLARQAYGEHGLIASDIIQKTGLAIEQSFRQLI